jgi:hypothetical protein
MDLTEKSILITGGTGSSSNQNYLGQKKIL